MMKNDKDTRIQDFLDQEMEGSGPSTPPAMDEQDLNAYRLVYDHLQQAPRQGLPLSFKANVLRRIEREKKQADDTRFYWLLAVLFLVGGFFLVAVLVLFKNTFYPLLDIINTYKGLIIIGISAVLLYSAVEWRLSFVNK